MSVGQWSVSSLSVVFSRCLIVVQSVNGQSVIRQCSVSCQWSFHVQSMVGQWLVSQWSFSGKSTVVQSVIGQSMVGQLAVGQSMVGQSMVGQSVVD